MHAVIQRERGGSALWRVSGSGSRRSRDKSTWVCSCSQSLLWRSSDAGEGRGGCYTSEAGRAAADGGRDAVCEVRRTVGSPANWALWSPGYAAVAAAAVASMRNMLLLLLLLLTMGEYCHLIACICSSGCTGAVADGDDDASARPSIRRTARMHCQG